MASEENCGEAASPDATGLQNTSFRLRSYQAEMVEDSLNENIIVAMDTGSGKTHIALARTAAELERCEPDKLVWILTPTVALCEQQHKVFESNLPGYCIQILLGKDNVDHWTDQSTWDVVLKNVRIALSTHQVLLDALSHGFVQMKKLALLIFDEAHHCTQNHPANLILTNFYHPFVQHGETTNLPMILGLSASPVMKATASTQALQQIEENMNATAKTPKTHRSELLRFVHRPRLLRIDYAVSSPAVSPLLIALQAEFYNYDLTTDPYVVDLLNKRQQGHDVTMQLHNVIMKRNTYCYQQLKTLWSRSRNMAEELGSSVSEWYVRQCIAKYEEMLQASEQLLEWMPHEKQHLLNILKRLPIPETLRIPFSSPQDLSPKVEALVDVLVEESGPDCTGLVFIEQRVWVAALAEILSLHPRTKDLFTVGTYVGTSQSSKRKTEIANLTEPKNQHDTLDAFRAGDTNLILATSVLEEGIDVSSCRLVICFERPKNLKSFVQRRGRARKQHSNYYIFLPESENAQGPESWEALEEEMKEAYLDDLRKIKQAEEREEMEEVGERHYRVESTGALLTLQNAVPHLNHFCATLGAIVYVDLRPQYKFIDAEGGRFTAEVTLPLSVNPAVRHARGTEQWMTERMAMKDASFQAYLALHATGLVNDNLLPAKQESDDFSAELKIPDNTPALVEVSQMLDPWVAVAKHQQQHPSIYHRTLVQLDDQYMVLLIPVNTLEKTDVTLYWNEETCLLVQCTKLTDAALTNAEISLMRTITHKLMATAFQPCMSRDRNDFLWLLIPGDASGDIWNYTKLDVWNNKTTGFQSASELKMQRIFEISSWGELGIQGDERKFTPLAVISNGSEPYIQATRVPKRRDFLHAVVEKGQKNTAYTKVEEFPLSKCFVKNLPTFYSTFMLLFPSILSRLETNMLADTLRTTILAPLDLGQEYLPLIIKAVTTSETGEEEDYQRLEFFGDCILKFIASVHLMASQITWPESYLAGKKDRIVCNGFAARATLACGLDKFIITKRFTGAKWAPRYAGDVLASDASKDKRNLSSKILADVIESLIGMSYVVGGFDKAFTCIQTLLPVEKWTHLSTAHTTLFSAATTDVPVHNLAILECLIDYKFQKKTILLEALTHASYTGPHANVSYERLEFLGDAVLDYIISKRLFAHVPQLSHRKMHGIRTCMVNAAFLSFLMFETSVQVEQTVPSTLQKETHQRWLWQFLRSRSEMKSSQEMKAAIAQHDAMREETLAALRSDRRFPWHLLALNEAPKFLSDIVESVIGGIYIDSQGDVSACEKFVRKLGILGYLQRILDEGWDCLHPKERLGHLALEKNVQYLKVVEKSEENGGVVPGATGKRMYRVQVLVGDVNVGGVVEGVKRLNAETRAAFEAVGILEERNRGDDVEMVDG